MVGPASYNYHECYKTLHAEPCNAVIKKHEKGSEGNGDYIFIGQNIIFDKEMGRKFPGCN